MDADGQIALCDFGLSQFLEDIEKSGSLESGGTAGYTAPEAIRGEHIPGAEAAVDVWSLGMVLLELALGLRYSYFYGDVSSEANMRVMEEELPLRHVQDTVLRDMLRGVSQVFVNDADLALIKIFFRCSTVTQAKELP